jgi:signal transduction histidine kinase/ActR/RegA family two-component response regulator
MSEREKVAGLESLFSGGGEVGAIMQQIDWATTSLGAVATWSQSLKIALKILLSSRFPMQILWGEEYIQFYNDAYLPIIGAKHPQGLGQRASECWAEVWDFAEPLLDRVRNTGEATWSEDQLLILNRSGYPEECYFTFSYSPIWEETGTVGGIFIAITETTQRIVSERQQKALQAAVETAKTDLENILASIHDEFMMLDAQWRFTYVNDQALKTLRKTQVELLGQCIWDVFPDAVGGKFYTELQWAMAEQSATCFEHFSLSLNRWFESRVYPAGGGLLLFYADITDRKQTEEKLRQSEARFQRLATNVPGVIYRYLLRADGSDTFTYISPSCRDMLELDPEVVQQDSSHLWAMVHPNDVESLKASIAHSARTLHPWEWKGRLRTPSGQVKWLQGVSRPEAQANGDVIWDGLLIDITHLKQVEAERELLFTREQTARQQAESANRIKDEFLAVLSHELRSPLNPILGWAKLLRQKKYDAATTTRALETIERNAKLQAQLIEDLLDVSRILRGKLSLEKTPIDLAFTIESALETVRLAAEAKAIDLRFILLDADLENGEQPSQSITFNPSTPIKLTRLLPTFQVLGDSNRLQQVFWNLLSNAIKFTPAGGRVEVSLERIDPPKSDVLATVKDEPEKLAVVPLATSATSVPVSLRPYAQIRVSDTGKGIHPHFLPYIFDYFRQADSATTRESGGLGLGLAIARHIVELHGGIIAAASPGEGKGATFLVQLPLVTVPTQSKQRDTTSELYRNLQGIRILVVDDEPDARELLNVVLAESGAEVTTVATANEALLALIRTQPDLLLSDVAMPEQDGYMLMQHVRRLPPNRGGQIPAIALTAYASELDRCKAVAAGFQKHLKKPIDPIELVEAVAELYHSSHAGAE